MKQLSDAIKFREQLSYAFEQACLPGLTDEQRMAQLTFVVIGSGPTGVELCGELRDFVAQDVPRLYRELVGLVRIVLLSSSNKVLTAFDGDLQVRASSQMRPTLLRASCGARKSDCTRAHDPLPPHPPSLTNLSPPSSILHPTGRRP